VTTATLAFENVHEGDSLPPLEKRPSLLDVVKWSGATWTFVPIFYDRDLARRQGLPDSLIPGPMKLAFLNLLLMRWAGPGARIRSLRVAYRRPDTPNQPLFCNGVVTRTARGQSGGLVDLELWIENSRGERTVSGAATVELPQRQTTPV
jgi:acyl dehydratase